MQIIPKVYLANGFAYGQFQNSYVVETEQGAVMIDSGQHGEDTFETVRKNCSVWGIDLAKISYLLVTHAHFDHSSYAARMQRTGVEIVASQAAAEAMACGDDRCLGYVFSIAFETCEVDRIVSGGEEISVGNLSIRCIPAPGHSNGSLIYEIIQEGRRLWFVGDQIIPMVADGQQCVELGWKGGPDYDELTYLESLRKLCHMECDDLFPGHGTPRIGGGRRLMEMAYPQALTDHHQ